MEGISHLNHVTGTEHNQISWFLLALVADIHLPSGHSNAKLIRSVRESLILSTWPDIQFIQLKLLPKCMTHSTHFIRIVTFLFHLVFASILTSQNFTMLAITTNMFSFMELLITSTQNAPRDFTLILQKMHMLLQIPKTSFHR